MAKKKVTKAGKGKAVKAKVVKAKAKPSSKVSKPVKKAAAKPVAKKKPQVKKATKPSKPSKPVKPAKTTIAPAKVQDVKPKVQEKATKKVEIVVTTPSKPVVKGKKPAGKPELPPELANLPKLPSNIHLKKQKGKLAPGEKRLVKTEVITHHVITEKPIEAEKKVKAEPKGKYSLEYLIRCPITLLYDFISTPSGLQEWFADDVNLRNDIYSFTWDGAIQQAKLLNAKIDSYLRFRWMDKPEGTYVEFRVNQDELTGEVSLVVTDFGENEEDIITNKRLWDSQIQRLIKVVGSY